MNIRLLKLEVNNFQGIKNFVLNCDSKDTNVFGENGAGKTTLKNAFTWLLFDKNTEDKKVFGVKPVDKEGNVVHGLETSVEGTFLIDGIERTFKRSIIEKVSTIRGTTETKINDETSWFIDGVPKKKMDYTKVINELIDEGKFKMITDPLYFNTKIDWKDRRNILMDICGDISDDEVISSDKSLEPLREQLVGGRSVEDVREITKHRMEPIAKRLKEIPIQIAEAEKAKPSEDEIIVDVEHKNYLTLKIQTKEDERSAILHGKTVTEKKTEKSILERELGAIRPFNKYQLEEYKELEECERKVWNSRNKTLNSNIKVENYQTKLNRIKEQKAHLSDKWDEVYSKSFTNEICPTCHQKLQPETVEANRKEFNLKKVQTLDGIEAELNKLLSEERTINEEMNGILAEVEKEKATTETLNQRIEELKSTLAKAEIEHNTKIKKEQEDLVMRIEDIDSQIIEISLKSEGFVETLERQIAELQEELNFINERIANKALYEKQNKRIEELKYEEKQHTILYSAYERIMFLTEQFVRTKANLLTDRINSNFTLARFKLFDIQKNEGIKETCEVMYQGVVFRDLNNAGRINIGLDIINTLCNRFNIQAPIFIDNAESVVNMFDTYSQQVRLVVSKDHKKLHVENVEGEN